VPNSNESRGQTNLDKGQREEDGREDPEGLDADEDAEDDGDQHRDRQRREEARRVGRGRREVKQCQHGWLAGRRGRRGELLLGGIDRETCKVLTAYKHPIRDIRAVGHRCADVALLPGDPHCNLDQRPLLLT